MKAFQRPKSQRELEEREAAGFWKAIGFVNSLSRDKNSAIDVTALCQTHRTIFIDVVPEIAGRYRRKGEDHKKLHAITPPPGALVEELMMVFSKELEERLHAIPVAPRTKKIGTFKKWMRKVVETAAWAQHKIVAIHPFGNGNGRTARLFTNLILQKHGLTGSRIKFEQSDKSAYLSALAQIDKVNDYEPLIDMILRAMEDQYKFILEQKKAFIRGQSKKKL